MKLWRVSRPEDERDYDELHEAVVWAESAEQAEELMRAAYWHSEEERTRETVPSIRDARWVAQESWTLIVEEVPAEPGVVLVHWHAG